MSEPFLRQDELKLRQSGGEGSKNATAWLAALKDGPYNGRLKAAATRARGIC